MYVGQESEDPADAAAAAAYDEAQNASLPPTRAEVKNVGAAAGGAAASAACIAYGAAVAAPLCAAIGSEIGGYIVGALFSIYDGLFAGETYVAPQFDHVIFQRTRQAAIRLANLRRNKGPLPAPTQGQVDDELGALEDWGVPAATLASGSGPTAAQRGPWQPFFNRDGLDAYLQNLTAAESALASEIIAARKLGLTKKGPGALPVIAGGVLGLGLLWWAFA